MSDEVKLCMDGIVEIAALCANAVREDSQTKLAAQAQQIKDLEAKAKGWRCYNCGVWFLDENAAEAHFGHDPEDEAACEINKRNDLVVAQNQQIADLAADRDEANEYIMSLKKDVEAGKEDLTVAIGLMNAAQDGRYRARDRAELAEAGCVAMKKLLWDSLPNIECKTSYQSGLITAIGNLLDQPSPGQALADRLAELERLDAAVQDDKLAARVVAKACNNLTKYPEMDAIRDYRVGLSAAKENPDVEK